ncbi:MAG: hypothetical protein AAGK00_01420 [Pseudomonadota bacterium]
MNERNGREVADDDDDEAETGTPFSDDDPWSLDLGLLVDWRNVDRRHVTYMLQTTSKERLGAKRKSSQRWVQPEAGKADDDNADPVFDDALSIEKIMQEWVKEELTDEDEDRWGGDRESSLHMTQAIWHDDTLGCAIGESPIVTGGYSYGCYWVCHYARAGNYVAEDTYEPGDWSTCADVKAD